jgi:serine/threonine-protein kinase
VTIEPGRNLLHYELVEKIGEGGMGVVWRAKDTSLGRDVAIKLLPAMLAGDADRLARFEREAKLLASLNHPHIATIHGLHQTLGNPGSGKVEGENDQQLRFLVMELIEGEDLQERIERGAIGLERTIEIAGQVALALEAAHAQGIVHRDLKPANIKLTAEGDVKVLDFGLAKALAPEAISGDKVASLSMSPTMTSAGTVAGMIIGTAAYMSPEQARGKPVDKRADMWAFGCLLFEMLTGRSCFEGETLSDTLASVLKEEPDISLLPADTPPAVHRLIRRCLAKDMRQRLSDAGSARLELSESLQQPPPSESSVHPAVSGIGETASAGIATGSDSSPGSNRSARRAWVITAVTFVVALTTIGMLLMRQNNGAGTAELPEPLVLTITIPPEYKLDGDQQSNIALSPDGRRLVFTAYEESSSTTSLFLRELDDATIVPLPDTAEAVNPFFSPDGQWVGFFADSGLKKIRIDGKSALPICSIQGATRGASWGDNDTIVFTEHFAGKLMMVKGSGGEPTALTELDSEARERTHRWPQAVLGHDVALFTVATTDSPEFYDDARIDAVRISTGERTTILENASFARYLSDGYLIFGRGGFLFGVPFDIDKLETVGASVPLVEDVMGAPESGVVYTSIAGNGLLAYLAGRNAGLRGELKWLDADGDERVVPGVPLDRYTEPVLSPDKGSIAVTIAGGKLQDLWVFDLKAQTMTRLTFEGNNYRPVWSNDGRSIIYYSVRDGLGAIYSTSADGSGGDRLFHKGIGASVQPDDLSPDGKWLLYSEFGTSSSKVFVLSMEDPEAEPRPLITGQGSIDVQNPRFSPDGNWIAYALSGTGTYQIFVQPFPGSGGRRQISTEGGVNPGWTGDGRQIHFRENRDWWAVDVEAGENRQFRAGVPRKLRSGLPRVHLNAQTSISPEGTSMLVAVPLEDSGVRSEITVIVDWMTVVKRKLGGTP